MKLRKRFSLITGLFILLILLLPSNVYAYLDPGTSSYLLSIILAGIVGAAISFKSFIFKVKNIFIKLFSRSGKKNNVED